MQLLNLALLVEECCLQVDFLIEVAQVFFDAFRVSRDDFVASAVVAKRTAKRDVDIQGKRAARGVAARDMTTVVICGKTVMKLQRGWVGGVPWSAASIALDQRLVEANLMCVEFGHVANRGACLCQAQSVVSAKFQRVRVLMAS